MRRSRPDRRARLWRFSATIALYGLLATVSLKLLLLYTETDVAGAMNPATERLFPAKGKLVLLVLDAVPAHVFRDPDYYPTIARLEAEGHPVGHHRAPDGFTTTAPIVKAMGTGSEAPPSEILDNFSNSAVQSDSLFRMLQRTGMTSALYGEGIWGDFFGARATSSYTLPDNGLGDFYTNDRKVFRQAMSDGLSHDFVVIHFVGSDHAGHVHDFTDPEYRRVSNTIDKYIGRLVREHSDYHFIITADHGMSRDRTHTKEEPDVVEPPVLFYGPSFAKDVVPSFHTLQYASTISYFLGVPPPASTEALPYIDVVETSPEEEAVFISAFHEGVVQARSGDDGPVSAPRSWDDLGALNDASVEAAGAVGRVVHVQAFVLLAVGLVGLLLYGRGAPAYTVCIPAAVLAWLVPGGWDVGLLAACGGLLLLLEFGTISLRRNAGELVVFPAVMSLALPFASGSTPITLESLVDLLPYLSVLALAGAMTIYALRRSTSLVWLGLVVALWSMFFLPHRWPQGAAEYAVALLVIGCSFWLWNRHGRSRLMLAGAVSMAAAWVPFSLAGGFPGPLAGDGIGLHAIEETAWLRAVALTFYAAWILLTFPGTVTPKGPTGFLRPSLPGAAPDALELHRGMPWQSRLVLALAVVTPAALHTHTGFWLEIALLAALVGALVTARSSGLSLLAGGAAMLLVGSSAQLVATLLFVAGFVILSRGLDDARRRSRAWLATVYATAAYYTMGGTFNVGRAENTILNLDLLPSGDGWVSITMALVLVKVSIPVLMALRVSGTSLLYERFYLLFALLGCAPLVFLYQRGYGYALIKGLPIILMFGAVVLVGRAVLAVFGRGAAGTWAVAPEPETARSR